MLNVPPVTLGATAADNGQVIFGYNQMVNNTLYAGSGTATMSAVGDILDNNGVFSGNTRQPAVTDGGAAAIAEFRARAQTAGVTMGSTLS